MSPFLTVDVRGMPRPQGSMTLYANGGAKYPPGVYVWRGQVQAAVAEVVPGLLDGPVEVKLGFDLPRPTSHYRTGRNAHLIRDAAPVHPQGRPDIDKLTRAVLDACTDAGLWKDDSQVVTLIAAKRYAIAPALPGVLIQVTEVP